MQQWIVGESVVQRELGGNPAKLMRREQWGCTPPGSVELATQRKGRGNPNTVPHALVGQTLYLRITATSVEVMHKGQRVAAHPRQSKERFVNITEHMPKSHQAHRAWSPRRFLNWARDIERCTAQVVKQQLAGRPHPEHGYRPCLGLLNLSRRYARSRLEKACERALSIRSTSYQSISSILKQGLDGQPLDKDADAQAELPLHTNVRGAGYYH
jgi:hypothetical protein